AALDDYVKAVAQGLIDKLVQLGSLETQQNHITQFYDLLRSQRHTSLPRTSTHTAVWRAQQSYLARVCRFSALARRHRLAKINAAPAACVRCLPDHSRRS